MGHTESQRIVFLTLDEAAAVLKVSAGTMRQYARQGIVAARKIGKSWRFLESDLMHAGEANIVRRVVPSAMRRLPVGSSRVAQIARNLRRRMNER
jgi:excisionase family DNA binding protein